MRYVVAVALAILLLAAFSQTLPAQQGPPGGQGPMMQGGSFQSDPKTFPDRKARVQKLLEDRKVSLEQEKACVDKATNDDELVKCRPQRPMHERGGMQHRGPMGDQGQQPPMRGPGGM